jgi:excisionase family DNA binding protein
MATDVKVRHLTAGELAERLGLDRWTVYALVKRKQSPRALWIGRRLRFRVADVEVWEANGGSPPKPRRRGKKTQRGGR